MFKTITLTLDVEMFIDDSEYKDHIKEISDENLCDKEKAELIFKDEIEEYLKESGRFAVKNDFSHDFDIVEGSVGDFVHDGDICASTYFGHLKTVCITDKSLKKLRKLAKRY